MIQFARAYELFSTNKRGTSGVSVIHQVEPFEFVLSESCDTFQDTKARCTRYAE